MDVSENEIGLREARTQLGELANRAEYAGQITYLMRHGRRVAAIVPIDRITEEPTVTISSAVVNLRTDMASGQISREDAILHLMSQFKLTRFGAADLLDNPNKAR